MAASLEAWQAAGAGREVLRWLKHGYSLPWQDGRKPLPFNKGVSLDNLDSLQQQWVRREIQRMFNIGALETATSAEFITKAFLVEKPTAPGQPKKWRIVVDLRWVNSHLNRLSCRYETLRRLHHLARPRDWLLSLDIQDGFYTVPVHPADRKYLTIHIAGLGMVQFASLPMGLSASPYVFTKVMRSFSCKPAALPWRSTRTLPGCRLRSGRSTATISRS